ncbi:VMAP-C domain-containing protein [Actinomadura madurae]|uniref:VMAP-C domain-containing protein n=1 Tax=Actinomadura madurae TaxID=1993 RepID=UPI0020D239D2|nr:hypothetical protein [Actinomadura madurae]
MLFQRRRASLTARSEPEPSENYLIIGCTPDALEPDRYLVTAWLQVDREPGNTLQCSDEALPLSRIPELLERLLTSDSLVVNRSNPELTIEFILPRPLLDHPFEQSRINIAGLEHRIGIRYPVVVRSLDRMRLAAVHPDWRHKWGWLSENSVDAPVCLVSPAWRVRQGGALFQAVDGLHGRTRAGLPALGRRERRAGRALGRAAGGVPVVAWCRDGRDPARFAREVKELLAADLMKLPRRTRELRRQALAGGPDGAGAGHLGLHLTLLFDDAERVPEPYVQLRPPA